MRPDPAGAAMSGLDAEPSAPGAGWRRLSPRMLLIHPIRELGRAIPALIAIVFAGSSSGHGTWTSLITVSLIVAFSVLRWFTTRYRISAEQVQLRTGLFRRRTITTPADRVRTVDVTAHALHRALGLARVAIGTGTSDRKREGLVLDGLSTEAAGRLRAELLHRAQIAGAYLAGADVAGNHLDAGHSEVADLDAGLPYPGQQILDRPGVQVAEQQVAALDPSWVRYAPFTLSGAVTALAILGFAWRIIDQAHVDAGRVSAVRSTADHFRDTPVWLDVAQIAVGVLLAVTVLSILGYLLAFWNFRLTRHPGGSLHISRGLITTRAISIEERRLRGVELSELLPLRLVGGARLLAIATGLRVGRGSERGGTLLLPPCPLPEAQRVAGLVLNVAARDPGPVMAPLRAHGPIARRRRLVRTVLPALAVPLALAGFWLAGAVPGWLAPSGLLLLIAVPLAQDRYRSPCHALAGRYLLTQFGSLIRRRIMLQTDGIIGWNLRQSYFQRRQGVATLTATTAAGRQGYRIVDLDVASALRLADAAVPQLLTEFLTGN
ncbi:MAG: PH domain-containing protein [Jatrophihabitans sp.]